MKSALYKLKGLYALCIILLISVALSACNGGNSSNNNATTSPAGSAVITTYAINNTNGVIDGTDIIVTLPFNTNVTALIATFTTTGASIKVGSTTQISAVTPNNFTSAVNYTVTGTNGTANYKVIVIIAAATSNSITAYSINGVPGVISGSNIAVMLPYNTSPTKLIATFTTTGTSVKIGSTTQISAVTPNNFSSPVIYSVSSATGAIAKYTVTVTIASASANSITSYSLNGTLGVIVGSNIAVTLPYGTNLTALVATFISSGTKIQVGGVTQVNMQTPNNFTLPVTYTVIAGNGTTANYIVTVTVASNNANALTAYSLNGTSGIIVGSNISVTLPFGTNLTALVATFISSGASVNVNGTTQFSTVTPNNFTTPVIYTVVAGNGTPATYTVTVTVVPSSTKTITTYSLNGTPGIISGLTIAVTVPYGTNVTGLIATFTTTGISVQVGNAPQTSTLTPNNFTSAVMYTVTAADGSIATYTVTVSVAANTAKAITAYSINGRNAVISGQNIAVGLPYGTDVTALIANFITTGINVKIGNTTQFSTLTSNNFTIPLIYTVTAADGSNINYTVTVTVSTIPSALHMFVTTQTSTGNLLAAANAAGGEVTNGVAGADYLCQVDAQCAIGTTCKAMLVSLGIASPMREASPTLVDWVLQANTTYYNMSEAPIGTTNGASTFNFPLTNTIGMVGANPLTWTGMNGTPPTVPWTTYAFTCNDWTLLSSTATAVGETDILNYLSISTFGPNCSTPYALYCAQQANNLSLYAGIVAAPGVPISGAAAINSNLSSPYGVAVDSNNNLYIADTVNSLVEKVTPTGIITIIAGGGAIAPSLSTAQHDAFIPIGGAQLGTFYTLSSPYGVAVDASGNVYIADTTNQFIERIDAISGVLSIVAGNGSSGAANGSGAATGSPLNLPRGVAVNSSGSTFYIADTGNSRIEKISGGIISYFAGTGTTGTPTAGGAATSSALAGPHGVAVDKNNVVYIADTGNSSVEVVSTGGILTIFAGTGIAGLPTAGIATSSKLNLPNSVSIGSNGNIYIADTFNNVIEQVTAATLSIYAGSAGSAGAPTPGLAINSLLSHPYGVAVYGTGSVYIADTANEVIEKVN